MTSEVIAVQPAGALPLPVATLDASLAAVAGRLQRAVVVVQGRSGSGAGTVWRGDGLIVTNSHVVPGPRTVVTTWDGRALPAVVIARDDHFDLALLQAEASGLSTVALRHDVQVRAGEIVLAIGHPWGTARAMSLGIVLAAPPSRPANGLPFGGAILADIVLGPGNSGGPLADAGRQVIGINTLVVDGMAVAVPNNRVEEFVGRSGPAGSRACA